MKKQICMFLAVVCIASAGTAIAQEQGVSVDVEADEEVQPGDQVTISVNARQAGSISINNVPSDWSVSDSQDEGAFISPSGQGDSIDDTSSVVWAWGSDQTTANVNAVFSVPDDAEMSENTLDITVEDSDGNVAEDSVIVGVLPSGNDSSIQDNGSGDNSGQTTVRSDAETEDGGSSESQETSSNQSNINEDENNAESEETREAEDNETQDSEDVEPNQSSSDGESGSENNTTETGNTDGEGLPGFTSVTLLIALFIGVLMQRFD